jgi:hypothetical protein
MCTIEHVSGYTCYVNYGAGLFDPAAQFDDLEPLVTKSYPFRTEGALFAFLPEVLASVQDVPGHCTAPVWVSCQPAVVQSAISEAERLAPRSYYHEIVAQLRSQAKK